MASSAWGEQRKHYTPDARKRRLDQKNEERAAMQRRMEERTARDPCARCCVRPEHHDEQGCKGYVEGRLRT